MKKVLSTAAAVLLLTTISYATEVRRVVANDFLKPVVVHKAEYMQATSQHHAVLLNTQTAGQIFRPAERMIIADFPITPLAKGSIELKPAHSIVDANTKITVHQGSGTRKIVAPTLSPWKGTISGMPGSTVTVQYGSGELTGYIQYPDGTKMLISKDESISTGGTDPLHLFGNESWIGVQTPFHCGTEDLSEHLLESAQNALFGLKGSAETAQASDLLELKLALDIRHDVVAAFMTSGRDEDQAVEAVTSYVVRLFQAVSQAYAQELNAVFYITEMIIWTPSFQAPYMASDGSAPHELLTQFATAWAKDYTNVKRDLAHCITMIRPSQGEYVGGIAFGGPNLCKKTGPGSSPGAYAVSTIHGNAYPNSAIPGSPTNKNGYVWDMLVTGHEIGHNVGAPHTHNCFWNPPVDTCLLKSDGTDACFNDEALRRVRPGTIMSYCHLRNGNSTPFMFGDRVSARMREWIAGYTCVEAFQNPKVKISQPRGPQSFNVGSVLTFRFQTARVTTVKIEYSLNDGGAWSPIASNVPASSNKFEWTIPSISGDKVWFRVLDEASGSNAGDTSLVAHSIKESIKITSPRGGENWAVGSSRQITWTKNQGIGNVSVAFASDGENFVTIQQNVSTNSVEWTVPAAETDNARIRVSASNEINDISEVFSIGYPKFKLLIPAPGAVICKNFDNQFRWNSEFIDRIRFQYTTNGGETWSTVTRSLFIDPTKWQVFELQPSLANVPEGTKGSIRVVDSDGNVLDSAEQVIFQSCDSATSVAELAPYQPFAISRVSPNPVRDNATVHLTSEVAAELTLMLVDIRGAILHTMNVQVQAPGLHIVEVPTRNLASGIYQIVVSGVNKKVASRIVVER